MKKTPDEASLKMIAAQLRKPEGDMGIQTMHRMNNGNVNMNKDTISKLDMKPGFKILEIGMANGFFVKDILSLAERLDYTGCDYSELMVSEATTLNKEFVKKGVARFVHSNVENMPFENNMFDRIFTVNTIYFWDNPSAVLTELYRVLKPGGKIVVGYRPKKHIENAPLTKYGFNAYSDDYIKEFFENNKLKVISRDETPEQVEHEGETYQTSVVVLVAEK